MIRGTVQMFRQTLEHNFNRNIDSMRAAGIDWFNLDDVHIFLGGNASKQHFVSEIMSEVFPNNPIQRIGEGLNDDAIDKMYAVNEKTAVAFGQLRLVSYGYKDAGSDGSSVTRPPFQFNIVYIDPGSDELVHVIKKGDKVEWRRAGKVDANTKTTALYYTADPVVDRKMLTPLPDSIAKFLKNPKKKTLFVRIHTEDSIEFRIGSKKDIPSQDEPVNEKMILRLK